MSGYEGLLAGVPDEEKLALRHLLDLVARVETAAQPAVSDFLDPGQAQWCRERIFSLAGLNFRLYGGYPGAERQRLIMAPAFFDAGMVDPNTGYVQIETGQAAAGLTHRDFLGAVLGLGVRREKVGDLLVQDNRCQAVVDRSLVAYLCGHLKLVGRSPARVRELSRDELDIPGQRSKEIRTTVASPRLDAIASQGFGLSRSRMEREIKAEKVRVNWRVVNKPDYQVKAGEVISCRGRGRIVVEEIGGVSRKNRLYVKIQRLM
ncbi:MAG: photosystem II S4 domain protein [Clostridia bacterium]|nr:MAG: photosystem II S4 domain protein [Clostridia bacterium]